MPICQTQMTFTRTALCTLPTIIVFFFFFWPTNTGTGQAPMRMALTTILTHEYVQSSMLGRNDWARCSVFCAFILTKSRAPNHHTHLAEVWCTERLSSLHDTAHESQNSAPEVFVFFFFFFRVLIIFCASPFLYFFPLFRSPHRVACQKCFYADYIICISISSSLFLSLSLFTDISNSINTIIGLRTFLFPNRSPSKYYSCDHFDF